MPANIKALKARIRSVDSTMHITKAMELVASSKIKRATAKMEESRFYRRVMEEAFADLGKTDSPYTRERADAPALYIAVAGDRGLAGGYNNNVVKKVKEGYREGDFVLPIGRRPLEYFKHHDVTLFSGDYGSSEKITSVDCARIGREVTLAFDEGRIGKVYLVYTEFVNMLTQEVWCKQLLPLVRETVTEANEPQSALTLYEPDAETVLSALIPEYIGGLTYCLVAMSFVSELAARRQAMDTATKNASDMIDDLSLRYNRARQGAITQEITEIIAGAGSNS